MPEKIISHPGNDNWYDNYDKVFGKKKGRFKGKLKCAGKSKARVYVDD